MSDLDHALADASIMRSLAAAPDRRSGASAWSVHQHIDHLVLAGTSIATGILRDAAQPPTDAGISLVGRLSLALGWIPRGRGRTPPALGAAAAPEHLPRRLAELAAVLEALRPLLPAMAADRRRWAHPVFGGLTRRQWLRFLVVHQRHHLAICKDIR